MFNKLVCLQVAMLTERSQVESCLRGDKGLRSPGRRRVALVRIAGPSCNIILLLFGAVGWGSSVLCAWFRPVRASALRAWTLASGLSFGAFLCSSSRTGCRCLACHGCWLVWDSLSLHARLLSRPMCFPGRANVALCLVHVACCLTLCVAGGLLLL